MSIYTDLIGTEGIKTDITVKLDTPTIINFGLMIFVSIVASLYVVKLISKLTE